MQLTKNFHLSEFTKSNTATRHGIKNNPTGEHISNLQLLCENILQPLRDHLNSPIRITSGYRGKELNDLVNGSSSSDHCHGKAGDLEFWIDGKEKNSVIFHAIKSLDLSFKQMIWEFGDEDQPNWIHISYCKDNAKKQILKAVKLEGKTQYILL